MPIESRQTGDLLCEQIDNAQPGVRVVGAPDLDILAIVFSLLLLHRLLVQRKESNGLSV